MDHATAVAAGYAGRPITNEVPVPAPLIVRGRRPAETTADEPAPDKWRAFGAAVLGWHRRVYETSMCRCGRTIVECDIRAQASQYGLPLPE